MIASIEETQFGSSDSAVWNSENDETQLRPVRDSSLPSYYDITTTFREAIPNGGDMLGVKRPLTTRLRPTLRLLQLFCYFPGSVVIRKTSYCECSASSLFFFFFSMFGFGVNMALLGYNLTIMIQYIHLFGILHAFTVSSIITGIKPFINLISLTVFAVNFRRHKRLLKLLDEADTAFEDHFGCTPEIEKANKVMCFVTLATFAIPLSTRSIEYVMMGVKPLNSWLYDLSLVLVPLLSVWNLLPLFYYELMNRIVRFWCNHLRKTIKQELRSRHRRNDFRFYYERFYQITQIQQAMGNLFNPFVLFSVGWVLFTLCLTIYFATQATNAMDDPPDGIGGEAELQLWRKMVYFIITWSTIQIFVSLSYVIIICYTGTKTNETTRKILSAVLTPSNVKLPECDRSQVQYFVHKSSSQYMWGMSVWRVFPLERTVFFTLVSLIVTYAFLLLKLKGESPAKSTQPTSTMSPLNITEMMGNFTSNTLNDTLDYFLL